MTNTRETDLRITAPPERGFVVWEGGEVLAAFGSRIDLAEWLAQRLGSLPGEREREARDFAAWRDATRNVEDMPRVAREDAEPTPPPRKRTIWPGRE
jgi:hypothetical protein